MIKLYSYLCGQSKSGYNDELSRHISLDDYAVIWPETLINDVLDDNLLDWKAIEDTKEDTDED